MVTPAESSDKKPDILNQVANATTLTGALGLEGGTLFLNSSFPPYGQPNKGLGQWGLGLQAGYMTGEGIQVGPNLSISNLFSQLGIGYNFVNNSLILEEIPGGLAGLLPLQAFGVGFLSRHLEASGLSPWQQSALMGGVSSLAALSGFASGRLKVDYNALAGSHLDEFDAFRRDHDRQNANHRATNVVTSLAVGALNPPGAIAKFLVSTVFGKAIERIFPNPGRWFTAPGTTPPPLSLTQLSGNLAELAKEKFAAFDGDPANIQDVMRYANKRSEGVTEKTLLFDQIWRSEGVFGPLHQIASSFVDSGKNAAEYFGAPARDAAMQGLNALAGVIDKQIANPKEVMNIHRDIWKGADKKQVAAAQKRMDEVVAQRPAKDWENIAPDKNLLLVTKLGSNERTAIFRTFKNEDGSIGFADNEHRRFNAKDMARIAADMADRGVLRSVEIMEIDPVTLRVTRPLYYGDKNAGVAPTGSTARHKDTADIIAGTPDKSIWGKIGEVEFENSLICSDGTMATKLGGRAQANSAPADPQANKPISPEKPPFVLAMQSKFELL